MYYDIFSLLVFGNPYAGEGVTIETAPDADPRGEQVTLEMIPADILEQFALAEEEEDEASSDMPEHYDTGADLYAELVDVVSDGGGAVLVAEPVGDVAEAVGTSGDDVIFGSGTVDMDYILETYFGGEMPAEWAVVDAA